MQSNERAAVGADILEIVRTFEAPRPLLFRLWGDPAHRARWWGPEGHGLLDSVLEFRVGGRWSVTILNPDGTQASMHGVFTELREPSRLAFTYLFDSAGVDSVVEIDFLDRGTSTEMRFRQTPFPNQDECANHRWGWSSSFDLLTDYLRRINPVDGLPLGRRRIDGVAADIMAAVERQQAADEQAPAPISSRRD